MLWFYRGLINQVVSWHSNFLASPLVAWQPHWDDKSYSHCFSCLCYMVRYPSAVASYSMYRQQSRINPFI